MFGLFKKKKQQTEALIEKDEHSGSDNGAADIAARTASNQATISPTVIPTAPCFLQATSPASPCTYVARQAAFSGS